MPAGIGFHPCFPARSTALFSVDARTHWPILPDFEVGEELASPFAVDALVPAHRMSSDDAYCLSRWSGRACVEWPNSGKRWEMACSQQFGHCVVFAPVGRDVFCLEPSSHLLGGIKRLERGEEGGCAILAPAASLRGDMALVCIG